MEPNTLDVGRQCRHLKTQNTPALYRVHAVLVKGAGGDHSFSHSAVCNTRKQHPQRVSESKRTGAETAENKPKLYKKLFFNSLYLAPQNLIGPSALPGLVPPHWTVYNGSWSSEINE